MLISFKKDKAFINILSDLEIFLSEAADKLDIDTKALSTVSTVDNTRKYRNWNKIETVDTSNYIKFYRYEFTLLSSDLNKIMVPWRGYDPSKDLLIKVYLDGKLLTPNRDYTIDVSTDSSTSESAGYYFNFGPYSVNNGSNWTTGRVTVTRVSTNLPTNVTAADIAITRYDHTLNSEQRNIAIDWGAINENDLAIEVYVNGQLYTEDNTATAPGYYKQSSTLLFFSQPITGQLSIIRYHKI